MPDSRIFILQRQGEGRWGWGVGLTGTESLNGKFATVFPVTLHSCGWESCQQTDIDLGIHRKIYLKKQNSPVRFLRSMDTKAKKAGGNTGNLTLTVGS